MPPSACPSRWCLRLRSSAHSWARLAALIIRPLLARTDSWSAASSQSPTSARPRGSSRRRHPAGAHGRAVVNDGVRRDNARTRQHGAARQASDREPGAAVQWSGIPRSVVDDRPRDLRAWAPRWAPPRRRLARGLVPSYKTVPAAALTPRTSTASSTSTSRADPSHASVTAGSR